MVLQQEPTEDTELDTIPAQDVVPDPAPDVPDPAVYTVVSVPEPEPEPEPDLAQQLTAAIIALRDAQMTHDDADTRQRKANMAVSDVETQRTAAVETQRLAVVSMGASRDGVLSAFDGLIATVQAARDAFRAG
jgi:hypothetical protein